MDTEKMRQYAATPKLNNANWVQKYLHKGELETQDYVRLAILVIGYLVLRPYIESAMKWYFNADPAKTSQEARAAAKAEAKISPNAIRGTREQDQKDEKLSNKLQATGMEKADADEIVLRRRGQGGSEFTKKTFEEQLLDWDDVKDIETVDGPRGDVADWVSKHLDS